MANRGAVHSPFTIHHSLSEDEVERLWKSIPFAIRYSLLAPTAILSLKVCDKAVGSGHFLVGAAHRLARHLARARAQAQGESEPSPLLYHTALRDVIGHCLYGVDINPMAVELCKVTLWLEALEPGKPLSFLDHHIRCGNSLLGATPELIAVGLPDDAFNPIEGDDKGACSSLKKLNRAQREGLRHLFIAEDTAIRERMHLAAAAIDEMSDSRPEDIHRKESAFRDAQSNYDFGKAWDLANLWCAAFVIKKRMANGESRMDGEKERMVNGESRMESPAPAAADVPPLAIPHSPLATQTDMFGSLAISASAKSKRSRPLATRHSPLAAPWGVTTQHLRDFVEGGALPDGLLAEAKQLADQYQFFHFHLAFPEVFVQGGFDVSLGNPPWERVKLQEKEWFAERRPDIANAPNAATRKRLIAELMATDPGLYRQFLEDSRKADGESHLLRDSGLYPLCGRGDINLYAVFAEGMRHLISPTGRIGCVLPSGIATDDTTKFFFQDVVERRSLVSLFDFENKGLFPGVHSSFKFCLFTSGSAQWVRANRESRIANGGDKEPSATQRGEAASHSPLATRHSPGGAAAEFVFFAHSVDDLWDPQRRFTLTAEDIALLNPNTHTCPIFRSRIDAELTKRFYQAGRASEPWQFSLSTLFHSSNDADKFEDADTLEKDGWTLDATGCFKRQAETAVPLYEGKMFTIYDHRAATVVFSREALVRQRQSAVTSLEQHQDPFFSARSFFWVRDGHIEAQYRWRWIVCFKKVTSPTNERTLITALLPACAANDSIHLLFPAKDCSATDFACLLGIVSSFTLDYVGRQKLGGVNFNFFVFQQLPLLPAEMFRQPCPWSGTAATRHSPFTIRDFLLPRVLELTYTAWDLEAFAQDCLDVANSEWGMANGAEGYAGYWQGYSRHSPFTTHHSPPPFRWDEERRFLLRCELDAAFFHLYLPSEASGEWRVADGEVDAEGKPLAIRNSLLATFPTPRHAVAYILDTFPIVKRKDIARTEQKNAAGEVVKPGRYITKDTILEIYDDLAESMQTGQPYQTCLDPPPADARCCHPPRT